MRVFNKIGQVYGFLIDNAYVRDDEDHRGEFLLTGVPCVNADGVLNDDNHEYEMASASPACVGLARNIST